MKKEQMQMLHEQLQANNHKFATNIFQCYGKPSYRKVQAYSWCKTRAKNYTVYITSYNSQAFTCAYYNYEHNHILVVETYRNNYYYNTKTGKFSKNNLHKIID